MNATEAQLLAAMQRAWDAGTDPAHDEQVQRLLEQDPTQLETFARWRRDVESLRNLEPTVAGAAPRGRPGRWVAAAAALIIGMATALAWEPDPAPGSGPDKDPGAAPAVPSPDLAAGPAPHPRARILSAGFERQGPRLARIASTTTRRTLAEGSGVHIEILQTWNVTQ